MLDPKSQIGPQKITLTTARVITAQVIKDLASILEDELKTKNAFKLSYTNMARRLTNDLRFKDINPATLKRFLQKLFPKRKLINSKIPKKIALQFLKENPKYQITEKLERASRILTKNPNYPIATLARLLELPDNTLRKYMQEAGIVQKVDPVEQGRRICNKIFNN